MRDDDSILLSEAVSLKINASAEICFKAICDFESYPKWQGAIHSAKIIKPDLLKPIVEFKADLLIRKISYILQYHISPYDHHLSWTYVEGDISHAAGFFKAIPMGDQLSENLYSVDVDPGFYVPRMMVDLVKKFVMTGVLKDLEKKVKTEL